MQDVIKKIISRHLGKVLINEKISNIKLQNFKVQQRCLIFIRRYPRTRHQNLRRFQAQPFLYAECRKKLSKVQCRQK